MNAIVRFDPFAGLDRGFGSLLDEFLRSMDAGVLYEGWAPPADVVRDEEGTILVIELPGFALEDIDVRVLDGTLVVSGRREEETVREGSTGHLVRREIRRGEFTRSFRIPGVGKDPGAVEAVMSRGMLTVRIPSSEGAPEGTRVPVTSAPEIESGSRDTA